MPSEPDPKTLREVADRQAICDVLNHYATCLDRRVPERIADEVFTPESSVEYGYGEWKSGAEAAAGLGAVLDTCERTAHVLTNIRVEVDGDEARSSAYVAAWHWLKDEGAPSERPVDFIILGVYVDRLRRTGQGWRVVHRRGYPLGPSALGAGTLPDFMAFEPEALDKYSPPKNDSQGAH